MFEKKFSTGLINKNDKVLMALSGGPDSVACLDFLVSHYPTENIGAFYLNHMLRDESSVEPNFCRKLCNKYGISFYTEDADVKILAKHNKKSLEEMGRIVRYKKLQEIARDSGYNKIITAHHSDDQVESIIMQFLKGSSGLNIGINTYIDVTKELQIVRPLLNISKQEIYEYLEDHNLEYCIDETNYETDFLRNKLRQILIPLIKHQINPGIDKTMLRYKNLSDELSNFIQIQAAELITEMKESEGNKFNLDVFKGAHMFLQTEVLKLIILEIDPMQTIACDHLHDIRSFLLSIKANTSYTLNKVLFIKKSYNKFWFTRELSLKKIDGIINLSIGIKKIYESLFEIKEVFEPQIDKNDKFSVILDYDKLDFASLIVRNRNIGDTFQPMGMNQSKKVKDFFIDRKVPQNERNEAFFVCDKYGILWIVGFEISDRVKITKNTSRFLRISMFENT